MSRKLRILFWVGVITLFVPFLGITSGMKTALTILVGALVVWLTLRLRHHYKELRYKLRRLEEPQGTPDITSN